tara:strand:+ start:1526 stop:1747 length:222 start_codon:yes stop_codon:yes gene_type:complete
MNNSSQILISEELINSFNYEITSKLAQRLEEDNYQSLCEALKDWYLLRAVSIKMPELTCNYIHLLDWVQFNED